VGHYGKLRKDRRSPGKSPPTVSGSLGHSAEQIPTSALGFDLLSVPPRLDDRSWPSGAIDLAAMSDG
jgi:hypothetical protein